MTFSILARCPATRMLGIVTATRSFAEARIGVVAVMSRADARLGDHAMGLLARGRSVCARAGTAPSCRAGHTNISPTLTLG